MSITINNKKIDGALGALLAVPVVVGTFALVAVALLTVCALLLSPVILIFWLVAR